MKSSAKFLNPRCSAGTLDVFGDRRHVVDALSEQLCKFNGTFLDIGCGEMPYKSLILAPASRVNKYIGMDLDNRYGAPDMIWNGSDIALEDNSIDCAMATEVFEHCPDIEGVLRESLRVLKPGGLLFFTVPFLWPLHDSPRDEYRYTPFALERHLKNVGFDQINLRSLGGWDASLSQMIGLWVRRRPMSRRLRRLLSLSLTPIVYYLFRLDSPRPVTTDQTMITGIAGTALKPALPISA